MVDSRIFRLNEQLKAFSNLLFNLGAATVGAMAARVFVIGGPDLISGFWFFGAAALIWLGAKLLGLMEVEG